MILFNITIISDTAIHEELKSWILNDFFPSIHKEKLFESLSLFKVLNSPNEGVTYSLQLKAVNEDVVNRFRENHLSSLHEKAQREYENQVYFFESLLEYQAS